MLTVDCNKRFTMDQIISHRWMQLGDEDTDFENVIREYNRPSECDPDVENLNETVLEHMESVHEFDRETTIKVSRDGRKPVFGVSVQIRHKLAHTGTEE